MKSYFFLFSAILFCLLAEETGGQIIAPVPTYAYKCVDKVCVKGWVTGDPGETPINICKLNCADGGSLWPKPTGSVQLGSGVKNFVSTDLSFTPYTGYPEELDVAVGVFKGYLDNMKVGEESKVINLLLEVTLIISDPNPTAFFKLSTNESYQLVITSSDVAVQVSITAPTYQGVRHGMETLSQLIAYDATLNAFAIVSVADVKDKPVYPYRGLMLDSSRNFISIPRILRLIDGMSYNKLNVLHWHITDTHSFPMQVDGQPNMTKYGSYSLNKVYTITQMKQVVNYARVRGVKVVPEFDAPAHTGNGWIWGEGAEQPPLAVCVNQDPWYDYCVEPPCGQLNIANDRMYEVLSGIYSSMMGVFDKDVFHMGGDEVDLRCYNTSTHITQFMGEKGWGRDEAGFMELWNYFQSKAYAEWVKYSDDPDRLAILWTSEFTSEEYIEKYVEQSKYAVQIWTEASAPIVPFLINNNYKVIFSNVDAWYLDCGFHNWIGDSGYNWCSPYRTWQSVYENSPFKIYEEATDKATAEAAMDAGLLLGGIAPLWTEQVDEEAMESRFWPRGSALAERLWSDPLESGAGEAVTRLLNNRQRYVERGLQPDSLQPEWCYQNEGKCVDDRMAPPPDASTPEAETLGGTSLIPFWLLLLLPPIITFLRPLQV